MAFTLKAADILDYQTEVVRIPGIGFVMLTALSLVARALLLILIGEQITDEIGNGISLIITVNIMASLPMAFGALISKLTPVDGIAEIGFFYDITYLPYFRHCRCCCCYSSSTKNSGTICKVVGRKMMQGEIQIFL